MILYSVIWFLFTVNRVFASQIRFNRYEEDAIMENILQEIDQVETASFSLDNCAKCKTLAVTLKRIPNLPIKIGIKIGIQVCIRKKYQPKHVCEGAAALFGPWILQVLKAPEFNSDYFCGVLDYCDYPQFHWNITIPPPTVKSNAFSARRKSLKKLNYEKFLHFSDYHIDPHYRVGFEAECEDPICCRPPHEPKAGVTIKRPAGPFGEYKCDSPRLLGLEVLKKAKEVVPSPKFVLISGDLPPHDIWESTQDSAKHAESLVAEDLKKYFYDQSVYMTIGNHESSPSNFFPPVSLKRYANVSWLYESLAKQWSHWLPESALETVSQYGYYSVYRKNDNLKIISLNTNFGYSMNFWNWLPIEDPNNMVKWLISELQESENLGHSVYLLGHIAPSAASNKYWSTAVLNVIERYSHLIAGQFYGHTHKDNFQVSYSSEGHPISVSYFCPSITPFDEVNPALRIFETDGTNQVVNHETYALNLPLSNEKNKAVWAKEYDAKSAYDLVDLSPHSWDDLTKRMEVNQTLVNLFLSYRTRMIFSASRKSLAYECDEACRRKMFCAMKSGPISQQCKSGFSDFSLRAFFGRSKAHSC